MLVWSSATQARTADATPGYKTTTQKENKENIRT
jgi:hypothetical protein